MVMYIRATPLPGPCLSGAIANRVFFFWVLHLLLASSGPVGGEAVAQGKKVCQEKVLHRDALYSVMSRPTVPNTNNWIDD